MNSFFSLLVFTLLVGCNAQPTPEVSYNHEPSWIMNPNQDSKKGAVGISGITYDQKISSQRKIAITRALDELTLQNGVKVELNMSKREVVKNDSSKITLDTKSTYNSSSTVTAHIEKVWKNKMTNEIFVWMVMD